MTGFDTIIVADWSAAKQAPKRPSKDAIWIAVAERGQVAPPRYFRNRIEAELWLSETFAAARAAGARVLACFDFPFGYPKGFARSVTGSDDPLALWQWFEAHITDTPSGDNNRYEIAEALNALWEGPGPFWGKPKRDAWPGLPYRKAGIDFGQIGEFRECDRVAQAASSCFQMNYPPTVGGQIMMGLPVLERLRRSGGVGVWPFAGWQEHDIVLAEIWPGLIEPAVKSDLTRLGPGAIRDNVQVHLLATALSQLSPDELTSMMTGLPDAAREEAWILGAGARDLLIARALTPVPPPLRNDCFALPPGVDWTPVDDALDRLRHGLHPVAPVQTLPLSKAAQRVLAADVHAARAHPPLPNSAVDGYGFAGGRPAGAHVMPLAPGRAAAGDAPGAVPDGQAMQVLTGAALPQGVDTVILQEDVRSAGGHIAFNGPIKPGANTRRAGEDVGEGDILLPAGARLDGAALALCAAAGVSTVHTRAPLRVGVLSTGSELVPAGQPAGAGQIYDANRPMLLDLVGAMGHRPVDLGAVPDDRAALRRALDGAQVDAILTSGGASSGAEDHVSALLTEAGAMQQWRIAMKPGRPLALGLWNGTPVFGLPGNPVAAFVCALIFARPALGVLAGQAWQVAQGFDVPANFSKSKKPGRREYLRARMRGGRAEVFASEGSGRVSGLVWAEGLVELPDGEVTVSPGDMVRFLPFSSLVRGGYCI
ncbi:MAG: molybdopterin-binding protein [Pseudomonadota bacterium]